MRSHNDLPSLFRFHSVYLVGCLCVSHVDRRLWGEGNCMLAWATARRKVYLFSHIERKRVI